MLFGIYIGSTIYVLRDVIKHTKEYRKKLEDEGYRFVDYEMTPLDILKGIFATALAFCPVVNLLYSFSLGSDNAYMYYKNRLLKDKKIVATNNVVESRVETPNVSYGQSLQCTLSPEEVEVIKKYRDQKQSAQEAALEKDAEALANFATYRSNVSNPNASFERPGYSYVKSRKQ